MSQTREAIFFSCLFAKKSQGWEFAYSLIAHLLIRSFCSFCSNQISDSERFAHDKWVKERFAKKMLAKKNLKSYLLVCFISFFYIYYLLIPSFLMSDVSESLRSLTKYERCEWIAQFAHQKWAIMSDSLRSLTKNEQTWANCSGR